MVGSVFASDVDFFDVEIKQQQKTIKHRINAAKTTAPMIIPAIAPLDKPLLPLLGVLEVPPLQRAAAAQFGVVDVGKQTSPTQPDWVAGNVYAVPVSSLVTGPIH